MAALASTGRLVAVDFTTQPGWSESLKSKTEKLGAEISALQLLVAQREEEEAARKLQLGARPSFQESGASSLEGRVQALGEEVRSLNAERDEMQRIIREAFHAIATSALVAMQEEIALTQENANRIKSEEGEGGSYYQEALSVVGAEEMIHKGASVCDQYLSSRQEGSTLQPKEMSTIVSYIWEMQRLTVEGKQVVDRLFRKMQSAKLLKAIKESQGAIEPR